MAKKVGITLTENDCLDYFKKALLHEMEFIAKTANDCNHQFGYAYEIKNLMCERAHSQLSV